MIETTAGKWLTTVDVAERLGISVRRVQQLIEAGRLPATQMGRDWFISPEDFKQFKPQKRGRPPKQKTQQK